MEATFRGTSILFKISQTQEAGAYIPSRMSKTTNSEDCQSFEMRVEASVRSLGSRWLMP